MALPSTPDSAPLERHYSALDLAYRLDISIQFVRKAISRGDLRAVKIGRRVRIPESAVAAWLSTVTSAKDGEQ